MHETPANRGGEAGDRLLVNFFYAPPVGHTIEALHYCLGHHLADPAREVSVVLNAAGAVELAGFCPFVSNVHAVDHPLLEPCPDSAARQAGIPRRWEWVVEDFRRGQDIQLAMFPGLRDYYLASDRLLTATRARTYVGSSRPGYVAHQQLRSLYPSAGSWLLILDALADAFPGLEIALIGKLGRDTRTTTSFAPADLAELLAHRSRPLDCFDVELAEQLAVVEACDLFLAPHTGFGMAALAVGTPWLALSGGRWFEYFFNRIPFRSIIPDPERYPSFTQFTPAPVIDDGGEGARTPSMSAARVRDDLDRIVAAAGELLGGSLTYERALRDYFAALLAAHGGDASAIWSIDGVHSGYI